MGAREVGSAEGSSGGMVLGDGKRKSMRKLYSALGKSISEIGSGAEDEEEWRTAPVPLAARRGSSRNSSACVKTTGPQRSRVEGRGLRVWTEGVEV